MGRLPGWAKGRMRNCVICDWWFPERDYRMRKREGKWVCKWCDDSLTKKLDKLGKKEGKYIRLGSYKRTQKQQHDLYLAYIRGYGNLAAKCNSRYTGEHSWDQCKQYPPCYSNHCGGKACDTSYYHQGRSGSYTNVGNNSSFRSTMKSLNICLPVGGEPWHVEHGNTWRS